MALRDLTGTRVVVTGASRGIGVAIAHAVADHGATPVLVARSREDLERVAASLPDAEVVPCDLLDPAARSGLVDQVGAVDGWVHNAGVEVPMAVADQTADEVSRQLELDLHAPIDLCRRAIPGLVARGRGALVLVSSMSGKGATPYNAIYTAAKHGLVGFAGSVGGELRGTGVHVGVVCPGFVSEGMWAETGLPTPRVLGSSTPEQVAAGVVRALRGAPEVIVTPSLLVRPFLALSQLFPRLDGWVIRNLGILPALEARHRWALDRRDG